MNVLVCNPYKMLSAQSVHHRDFKISYLGLNLNIKMD